MPGCSYAYINLIGKHIGCDGIRQPGNKTGQCDQPAAYNDYVRVHNIDNVGQTARGPVKVTIKRGKASLVA